jgi:hypothetical protein
MRQAGAALLALPALGSGCWAFEGGRRYAVWQMSEAGSGAGRSEAAAASGAVSADCFRMEPWISQSARDGVGVTVRIEGRAASPCDVELGPATLEIGEARVPALRLPPRMRLTRAHAVTFHLWFPFDDWTAWDRGEDDATLLISATAAGRRVPPLRWALSRETREIQ